MASKSFIFFSLLLFFAAIGLIWELIHHPLNTIFTFVFAAIVLYLLNRFLNGPSAFRQRPFSKGKRSFYKTAPKRSRKKRRRTQKTFRVIDGRKNKRDDNDDDNSSNRFLH